MEEINEKQIYKEAMKQTTDTIGDFVKHAMCDYQHDYGSVCVAVAGSIGVSRLGLINHETLLLDVEMDTILAVAIGGNSLGGGRFRLSGSIIGAYVIQMLTITLYAMEVPSTDVKAYKAIVIIILVVIGSPVVKKTFAKFLADMRSKKAEKAEKGAA